jgi:hypothetical protein
MDIKQLLRKVDDVFFDTPYVGFQVIASRIEYLTSTSPITLGRLCFVLSFTIAVWSNYQTYLETHSLFSLAWIFVQMTVLIYFLARSYHPSVKRKSGVRNPFRVMELMLVLRIYAVLFCVTGLLTIYALPLMFWSSATMAAGMYFLACDLLPPGERFSWSLWRRVQARA